MSDARRADIKVTWLSKDITRDLDPHLLGLTYGDNLSGAADDLGLELEDRDGLWSGDWKPTLGDTVEVEWSAEPWATTVGTLKTGTYAHDKITMKGPPRIVNIKAVSAPLATGLRRRKRTHGWSGSTLKQIAQDIASRAGMKLLYTAEEGFHYKRKVQKNQSDLDFLEKLCKKAGQALKVTDGQIVIFDELDRDKGDAVCDIDLTGGNVKEWDFDGDDSDRYGSCRVSCMNPRSKKKIVGVFNDPDRPDGQTLEVVHHCDTVAEAKSVARALLFNANRFATSGTLTTVGDCGLVAGVIFNLKNARGFDGKFIIDHAEHHPKGGYTCTLKVRRCLESY